jgi:flagellar biosynthetic protein FliR
MQSTEALWRLLPGPAWGVTVFLLALRLGAVLLMTPLLHAASLPAVVRILLVFGLAAALAAGLSPAQLAPAALASDPGALIASAAVEVALGALLALAIFVAFGAIAMAGRMLDVQIGFGMPQILDPATRQQLPVVTSAFNLFGVLMFFVIEGHHALLRGIVYSIERFPLGRGLSIEAAAPAVLKQVAGLFTLGVALAAPVIVCMLMVDLALGVLSRNLPQMNIFVVGLPIKIMAGLAALSLWAAGAGEPMGRVFSSIYQTWDAVFAAAAPVRGAR